ncbi:hypothetical protein ACTXT7_011367 [Hymenolepis weldensis]
MTRDSFKKLATISSDRKWSSTYPSDDAAVTSWLIRFRPQTDRSMALLPTSSVTNGWMRLAIRDQGACLMLDRIRVYYLSCPAWQLAIYPTFCPPPPQIAILFQKLHKKSQTKSDNSLAVKTNQICNFPGDNPPETKSHFHSLFVPTVRFMSLPETPAGHDAEVREVQGHCVAGAEPTIISQSELNQMESSNQSQGLKPSFCKANGQWHILQDNVCECLPGYESSVEENLCSKERPLEALALRAEVVKMQRKQKENFGRGAGYEILDHEAHTTV